MEENNLWESWISRAEEVNIAKREIERYGNGLAKYLGVLSKRRFDELVTLRWVFWEYMCHKYSKPRRVIGATIS